jgi:hypothetical protein
MTHKFQVGQTVLPAHPRGDNPGTYVIVQVLPETSHERQYRIKSLSSASECVVSETQIKTRDRAKPLLKFRPLQGVCHACRPAAEAK